MKTEMDVESFQRECQKIHEKISDLLDQERPIPEIALGALMSTFSSILFALKVAPEHFKESVDECAKTYKEIWDDAKKETNGKEI